MLTLDFLVLGFSTSLQTLCRTGLSSLVFGKFSSGPSSISVMGYVLSDLSLPARSFARFGLAMFVLNFVHYGSTTLLQSLAHCEPVALLMGVTCLESLLSPPDSSHSDFSIFARRFAHLDTLLLTLDFLNPELVMLAHSSVRPNLFLSPVGVSCPGSSPFLLDFARMDSSLLLRSFA